AMRARIAGAHEAPLARERDPRDCSLPARERAPQLRLAARVEPQHATIGMREHRVEAAARQRRLCRVGGGDRLGAAAGGRPRAGVALGGGRRVEQLARAVVVLDRAAALRAPRQLDEAELLEPPDVVADRAEGNVELGREFDRTHELAVAQDVEYA